MTEPRASNPRLIRLRRPAILSVADGVFVPEGSSGLMDEVEGRWAALCEDNPAYFDGRLYHVLGVHRNGHGGATVHVVDCAYRFHAVQDEAFDLGVRPLGVKAMTWREGRVLMGKRTQHVHAYRGEWEFAPGGVVDLGEEPAAIVAKELQEETGLAVASEPVAIAMIYDDFLRDWEIVHRVEPGPGEVVIEQEEYDELRWCTPDNLPDNLCSIARQMTALL